MDSRQRFSSRVDNYIKYRPGYPRGVIDQLQQACGLSPASVVADVGSGTGLLARLFLDLGCGVYGIEPNAEMRSAGERLLAGYPNFSSQDGSAESTGLPDASVDFVTAGQAFHWFDPARTRAEFKRVLKPDGWAALVWNDRSVDTSPFLKAYEALLNRYSSDYQQVNHRNIEKNPQAIAAFFGGAYQVAHFKNVQVFDYEGVRGRLESSSYAPEPGQPSYAPMMADLRRIFDTFQQDGRVNFEYDTELFYGRIV